MEDVNKVLDTFVGLKKTIKDDEKPKGLCIVK